MHLALMSQKTSRVREPLELLAAWFLAFVWPIVLVHVFTILVLAMVLGDSILFAPSQLNIDIEKFLAFQKWNIARDEHRQKFIDIKQYLGNLKVGS